MSSKAREKAAEEGVLPHEWLLAVARGQPVDQKVFDKDKGKFVSKRFYPPFEARQDAAKAAAPFYAPKLAAQTIDLSGTVKLQHATDEELDREIEGLLARKDSAGR